jgi:hypothetical protein
MQKPMERVLLDAFDKGTSLVKIYRGLPRVYRRERPSESRIKEAFAHLPSLRRSLAEDLIFPLYESFPIPPDTHVSLFTWVIGDGWGDWIAAKEALHILQEQFPSIAFHWIALVPKKFAFVEERALLIPYEKEAPLSLFPTEAFEILRTSDLILSLPTFYPHTADLMQQLQTMPGHRAPPQLSCLGQYGYVESSWFHPQSGHRSLGLHFLEKGILLRRAGACLLTGLCNEALSRMLFATAEPTPLQVEHYLQTHQFYLAYLLHPLAGAVYLHALFESQIASKLPIDICTPNLDWYMGYIAMQNSQDRDVVDGDLHIQKIEVHHEGKIYTKRLAEEGKLVRILCPGPITDHDFRLLVRWSSEPIAVRGDQSFSEVVSAGRAFFYDGAPHARYFVKDLLALAENRLLTYRSTRMALRAMFEVFLHVLPPEEGEWVEETHFQEKKPWRQIAHQLASALKAPDIGAGFRYFSQLLCQEKNAKRFLCQLVQRELAHRQGGLLAQREILHLALFATQQCDLDQLLHSISDL